MWSDGSGGKSLFQGERDQLCSMYLRGKAAKSPQKKSTGGVFQVPNENRIDEVMRWNLV